MTSKEVLEDLYIHKNMTMKEIGEHLGVTGTTIGRWLKEFEIHKDNTKKAICKECGKTFILNNSSGKYYCSRECQYEAVHKKANANIIRKFEEKYGDKYEVVSCEYGSESKITFRCKDCGDIISYRKDNLFRSNQIRCFNCIRLNNERKKEYKAFNKALKKYITKLKSEAIKSITKACNYCGNEFTTNMPTQKYCCKKCREKANNKPHKRTKAQNKLHELKREKRIKNNGAIDRNINLETLYEKDKGVCKICGCKCDYNDYEKTEEGYFIAHNNYPSIDHIIPLSKGGTHTWDNVQLAHFGCNSKKRDMVVVN